MDAPNRNERRLSWWRIHGSKHNVETTMTRRHANHDYRSPAIYMVTLVVNGRRPILGELVENDGAVTVQLSPLGHEVAMCWQRLPRYYPQLRVLGLQMMPDHLHGILQATERMDRHLGQVINGFKKGCNDACRALHGDHRRLWEAGYNDCVLQGKGQLEAWFRYLRDNPRRLWVKRHHSEYFVQRRRTLIDGSAVTIMGNAFLFEYPHKVVVQCSRSLTTEQIQIAGDRYMEQVIAGAVLVSACISPGEKAIMRRAFDAGARQIVLIENGFAPVDKPHGESFDACADGRLLLVAPWEHHNDRRTITRTQCLALNSLAAIIASM